MSLHELHKYHAAVSGAIDPELQRLAKRCTLGGWNVTTEDNGTPTQKGTWGLSQLCTTAEA